MSEGFIPLEEFIRRWEYSINEALVLYAEEIAKQASSLLRMECKVTDV